MNTRNDGAGLDAKTLLEHSEPGSRLRSVLLLKMAGFEHRAIRQILRPPFYRRGWFVAALFSLFVAVGSVSVGYAAGSVGADVSPWADSPTLRAGFAAVCADEGRGWDSIQRRCTEPR